MASGTDDRAAPSSWALSPDVADPVPEDGAIARPMVR
jgi:hypothetical protein